MVGKSNLPMDAERRSDLHGAACTAPGFSALDEEREASMADEGGTSGALSEAAEAHLEERFVELSFGLRRPRESEKAEPAIDEAASASGAHPFFYIAASAAIAVSGGFALGRWRRR